MKIVTIAMRCLARSARAPWFAWFGLVLILLASFGCRFASSHDSPTFSVGAKLDSPTGVTGLVNLKGRPTNPFLATQAKAFVFIFVETDCPISNRYAPEVQRLFTRYTPHGIDFWLVYPAPERRPAEIQRHVKEFRLSLGVLRDPRHALVKQVGAQVTPEAAVILRDGSVAYRGCIDDRIVGFGQERLSPTQRYLEEAIRSILDGKPVKNPSTTAVGCYIPALP